MRRGRPAVPEREAAKAAGERFYSTGKPCANGHMSKRYTSTGICAECAIKNTLKSAAKRPWHPERIAAKERGDLHFSTGVPCRNGHVTKRFVHDGTCTECRVATQRRFHEAHPELWAEWARKQRARNPEPHRKSSSKWARTHPENVRANVKKTKERNPEHWRKKVIIYTNTRRARKLANGGDYTVADIDALFVAQSGKCAGCGHAKKLEIDHIIPIARGGLNAMPNLQLLCRKCNASKGARTMDEWLHWRSTVT